MPERDLDLLIRAAEAASDIANRYWSGPNRVWQKGPDDPVSEADIAVDTFLRETLLAARPGYGWLSEESEDDGTRLDRKRLFVVDPIDGTRAFIAGQKTWALSLAVVESGRPVAGVVLLPQRQKLYAAQAGDGASKNGEPLNDPVGGGDAPVRLLANRAALAPRYWPGGVPEVEWSFRTSLAYRICLVAEGRFDAALTLRDSWEWDTAAGVLIATEAGCTVTDRTGAPLRFNTARAKTAGVLAAAPPAFDRLIGPLSAA